MPTRNPAAAASRTPVREVAPARTAPVVNVTQETLMAIARGLGTAIGTAVAARAAQSAQESSPAPPAPAPVPLHTLSPEQFSAHAKATFAPTFAGPAVSDWAGQMWRARSAELAVGQ
ncbi:MAG TPA: hypothetical protein VGX23_33725 [Actinocrinis sp.]|nr:hypothetical protein [Actinocrinis sp.]